MHHRSLTLSLLSLSLLGATAACGAPNEVVPIPSAAAHADTWTLHEGVITADQTTVDTVVVAADRLVLPGGSRSALAGSVKVGTVLVGDRSAHNADNRFGFLRKVTSVDATGRDLVLLTTAAVVSEVFDAADLSLSTAKAPASAVRPSGTALQLLDDQGSGGGGGGSSDGGLDLRHKFTFDAGTLHLPETNGREASIGYNASLEVGLKINPQVNVQYTQAGFLQSPKLDIDATLPWTFRNAACLSVEGELERGVALDRLTGLPKEPIASVPFPLPPAGPIPLTGQVSAELACFPFIEGKYTQRIETTVHGTPHAKFGYDNGFYGTGSNTVSMEQQNDIVIDGKAGFACEIQLRFTVLVADAAGAFVQAVPRVELSGEGKASIIGGKRSGSFCEQDQANVRGEVGLTATLWGITELEWTQTVAESDPYVIATTCAPDSCSDKSDGWYCSDVAPGHAYQCSNQSTSNGNSCAGSQVCQRANAGASEARVEDGTPACGDAADAPSAELTCL